MIPRHPRFTPSHKSSLLALAVVLSLSRLGAAQIDDVLKGSADPSIIRVDGDGYYVFATGRGANVWRSDDLLKWKQVGRVFDGSVPRWTRGPVPKSQ